MMKKLLYALAFVVMATGVMAQGYYVVPFTGNTSEGEFPGRSPASKQVMDANKSNTKVVNDEFSAPQPIPFDFEFYGEKVSQYIVSENGYITFDVNEKTPNGENVALPSVDAPKKAIFAFWDELALRQLQNFLFSVNSWTYGEEGNRTHVIHWYQISSTTTPGIQEILNFSIHLHEDNTFDIVHERSAVLQNQTAVDETGTVGIQNGDGTVGINLQGPNQVFPTSVGSSKDDDKIYRFIPGDAQPEYDVAITGNNIPLSVKKDQVSKFSIEVLNFGSEVITSLDYSYTVNGGTPVTGTISNVLLASGGSRKMVEVSKGFTATTGGEDYEIDFTITKVNGQDDADPSNNVTSGSSLCVLGTSAERRVLVEEFSTAPCGFCPDGALVLERMKVTDPTAIISQHHAGFGTDAMTIPEHQTYAAAYAAGAPSALIDRHHYEGEDKVAFSRNLWETRMIAAKDVPAPVAVDVATTYDDETNTLTANVDLEFVDYAAGDLRLTVFVQQTMVTGEGQGYDQRNYYSNGQYGTDHPYYLAGDPIVGYWHKDVVRAVLTDVWGDPLTIAFEPGSKNSYTFSQRVNPARWDKSKLHVVAFVNQYNADPLQHGVLNAGAEEVTSNIQQVDNANINAIYPNPTNGNTTIDLSFEQNAQVNVKVMNTVGQQVAQVAKGNFNAGNHTLNFDATTLESGIYMVNVTVDGQTTTQKLIVQ